MAAAQHQQEVLSGERFEFGQNWARFLGFLNDDRIRGAEESLKRMLAVETLKGKRFLDAGSGSGLFSLAARRLGAEVFSFDYDPASVACTRELKRRYFADSGMWTVEEGSVLDNAFLARLGHFDVVYSWGVLHHTGAMWPALANAAAMVADGGKLFIAIYNDQGTPSRRWLAVKRLYNRLPSGLRWTVLWPAGVHLWWRPVVKDFLRLKPFQSIRTYSNDRGMSVWRDLVDWVGGYPFEVAKPEQIFSFYRERGFELIHLTTCSGSLGCNEFVFQKTRA